MKNVYTQGKEVSFKSLLGIHVLSAVETGYVSVKDEDSSDFENCNFISFVLDGKTYTAIEDPSDGYRSSMRCLKVSKRKLNNVIPDTQVLVVFGYEDKYYATENILWFYSTEAAELVLKIGTEDCGDYYPSFLHEFIPKNLPCNVKKTKRERTRRPE
jgi:hypothetical protein